MAGNKKDSNKLRSLINDAAKKDIEDIQRIKSEAQGTFEKNKKSDQRRN